jgi:replication factor C subunit 2/4
MISDIFDTQCKNVSLSASSSSSSIPWIEKYRPKNISDVISQDNIINMLKTSIKNNNLQHLLFYGPPGTGKTSTILALGHEIFGPEHFKNRIIELNASDDCGISAVRNKIKVYAKNAVNKNSKLPPYKIIILDEADSMTSDAQSALRKIMEDFSHITRFCIICNYINKIIDPIASRCAKFKFLPIGKNIMYKKLAYIADSEEIKYDPDVINTVIKLSNGDMRKAIMILQNIKYCKTDVDVKVVMEITGYINHIKSIVQSIKVGPFDNIVRISKSLINDGYAVDNYLEQFYEVIVNDDTIDDNKKSDIVIHLSKNQKNIIDGADEYLQILDINMYTYMVITSCL